MSEMEGWDWMRYEGAGDIRGSLYKSTTRRSCLPVIMTCGAVGLPHATQSVKGVPRLVDTPFRTFRVMNATGAALAGVHWIAWGEGASKRQGSSRPSNNLSAGARPAAPCATYESLMYSVYG